MRCVRALAAAFALCSASTSSPLSIRFDPVGAAKTVPIVAWVQIATANPIIGRSGGSCGVRYTARVVKKIKGASEGQTLTFGYFQGRPIDGEFIVFLQSKLDFESNVNRQRPRPAFANECTDAFPDYLETAEGLGTIPVSRDSHGVAVVRLNPMLHVTPLSLVPIDRRARTHLVDGTFFNEQLDVGASTFASFIRNQAGKH